jgi:DNA-binding NarL/FixJ family response regulator
MLFEANGYRVVAAGTAAGGAHDARLYNSDVVIVDLGLPDRDGTEVIKAIRAWSAMPIIVLSARTAETQRLGAFEQQAPNPTLLDKRNVETPYRVSGLTVPTRSSLRGKNFTVPAIQRAS